MSRTVKLAFLGDLMLGRGISRRLRDRPPDWFWGDALPLLRRSDAVIANLESPITASRGRWWRTWKMFHFKADPAAVRILTEGNIRFVCLANNHALDYGARGLLDTLAALDGAGIVHAGAGRARAEAMAWRIIDVGGLRIGLIAATDSMPEFAATQDKVGTHHVAFRPGSPGLDWVENAVFELRHAGASLIVLSLHWGPNMRKVPSTAFRLFAQESVDRGVDVVHGHSAHVVQAIERHGSGVILYDTGNFIDDYWKFPMRRTIWSFVFTLVVEDGRPRRLELVPVLVHPLPPMMATGGDFRAITANLKSLCAPLGTPIVDTAQGLEIALGDS